jgi:septation ring formation regulator EzrA
MDARATELVLELREEIAERMTRYGTTLEEIEEELIDTQLELTEDAKSALWLFAWSYLPAEQQRARALQLQGSIFEGFVSGPERQSAEKLAEVMAAVREWEDRNRALLSHPRPCDETLSRRVRQAL